MVKHSYLALGAILLATAGSARADVRLPAFFSDNMVLQRNAELPVWGTATPGEAVRVDLAGKSAKTVADAEGNWKVRLPPRAEGKDLQLTVKGANTLTFKNVVMGEIWLASGQSNMEWKVSQSLDPEKEIAEAKYPDIRLFTVARQTTLTPQTDVQGKWEACSLETIPNFSAVAYFYGRELHQKLGVPIGLIHSSWGGTGANSWISRPAMEVMPEMRGYLVGTDKRIADYPAAQAKFEQETLPAWQAEVDKAQKEGKPLPAKPQGPWGGPNDAGRAASLFNGMINPLIPFAIRGVIWYQGESNANNPMGYRLLFPALIKDWRTRWGQGDFPFLWVQLAGKDAIQTTPIDNGIGFPALREAQTMTLALPNTGMATALDLFNTKYPTHIHPPNKQDVGRRLAMNAFALVYGQKVPYSGPVFSKMAVEGNKIRISYTHTDGGLRPRGDVLKGFIIADAAGEWKWADAVIEGETVVISSPDVAAPTRARYAWAMNPIGNLENGAGLPAIPFRTDMDSKE